MNLAESLNNILQIIDGKCTDAGGEIHVNPAHLGVFSSETEYLWKRMQLTPFQAVLFAVIIQCNATGRCTFHNIAKHLGMTYLQFLSYASDLYALRDKWLIRLKGNSELKVPADVINALMNDAP